MNICPNCGHCFETPANRARSDFDRFWECYPRKVGKRSAERIFWRLKGLPDIATLIKIVDLQKQSDQWQKNGGEFIPHPSTWLNQGRWEDELPESEFEKRRALNEESKRIREDYLAKTNRA